MLQERGKPRITWVRQKDQSCVLGSVGGVALFELRFDARTNAWWVFQEIDAMSLAISYLGEKEARSACETALARFIRRLGAQFPHDPETPEGNR